MTISGSSYPAAATLPQSLTALQDTTAQFGQVVNDLVVNGYQQPPVPTGIDTASTPGELADPNDMGDMSSAAASTGDAHGADGDMHMDEAMPGTPPSTTTIRSILVSGSYGPIVEKGDAKTIDIPDGSGFGGIKGRQQNAGDRQQNNYSVTDANFFPQLGLLQEPDGSGTPMNYVKQIQAYNAAGYISAFHPDVYATMVQIQDSGQGSILGMALDLMGVDGAPTDPGMAASGLTPAMYSQENVPGSPIPAKTAVMSGTDLAGEEWARPHHAESSWDTYKALTNAGLDYQTAFVLSGDDAMSGAGRMNGFNNQDGTTGLNADEKAVYQIAAQVEQQTGIPVVQIMASGHSHTGLADSAKTDPRIDKLIGMNLATSDKTERNDAIYQAFASNEITGGDIAKYDLGDGHRGYGLTATTSPVLANAVKATQAVQPQGIDGFMHSMSDGAGDLLTNVVAGVENLITGFFGMFSGLLGGGAGQQHNH